MRYLFLLIALFASGAEALSFPAYTSSATTDIAINAKINYSSGISPLTVFFDAVDTTDTPVLGSDTTYDPSAGNTGTVTGWIDDGQSTSCGTTPCYDGLAGNCLTITGGSATIGSYYPPEFGMLIGSGITNTTAITKQPLASGASGHCQVGAGNTYWSVTVSTNSISGTTVPSSLTNAVSGTFTLANAQCNSVFQCTTNKAFHSLQYFWDFGDPSGSPAPSGTVTLWNTGTYAPQQTFSASVASGLMTCSSNCPSGLTVGQVLQGTNLPTFSSNILASITATIGNAASPSGVGNILNCLTNCTSIAPGSFVIWTGFGSALSPTAINVQVTGSDSGACANCWYISTAAYEAATSTSMKVVLNPIMLTSYVSPTQWNVNNSYAASGGAQSITVGQNTNSTCSGAWQQVNGVNAIQANPGCRNNAIGAVAAHVYELPLSATGSQTFTPTLYVTDGRSVATKTFSITVQSQHDAYISPSGTAYCVNGTATNGGAADSDFTGCPSWVSGGNQIQQTAFDTTMASAGGQTAYYFKRGDFYTYATSGGLTSLTGWGHTTVGAYGSAVNPPKIYSSGTVVGSMLNWASGTVTPQSDIRIEDIAFDGGNYLGGVEADVNQLTLLRVNYEHMGAPGLVTASNSNGAGDNSTYAYGYDTAWVDSSQLFFPANNNYAMFWGGQRQNFVAVGNGSDSTSPSTLTRPSYLALMGLVVDNFNSNYAATDQKDVRIDPAYRYLLENSTFIGGYSGETITLRQNGRYAEVMGNYFGGAWESVEPENLGSNEFTPDIIIENNLLRAGSSTQRLLWLSNSYVDVRNNIFDETGGLNGAVKIYWSGPGAQPEPSHNNLFNNTIYWGTAPSGALLLDDYNGTGPEIAMSSICTMGVYNNLIYNAVSSTQASIKRVAGSACEFFPNNTSAIDLSVILGGNSPGFNSSSGTGTVQANTSVGMSLTAPWNNIDFQPTTNVSGYPSKSGMSRSSGVFLDFFWKLRQYPAGVGIMGAVCFSGGC